jgi:hypothetical protein
MKTLPEYKPAQKFSLTYALLDFWIFTDWPKKDPTMAIYVRSVRGWIIREDIRRQTRDRHPVKSFRIPFETLE